MRQNFFSSLVICRAIFVHIAQYSRGHSFNTSTKGRTWTTVVTAGHCMHAELISGHTLASCCSCCMHSQIWGGRSVGNVSTNVYAIKKALGIFDPGELIPTTRTTTTTRVAFWVPPSGSHNSISHVTMAYSTKTGQFTFSAQPGSLKQLNF